jgi:hypothetical protein
MCSRIVSRASIVALAALVLSGCSPSPPAGGVPSGANELPGWVRMSVPVRDGRSIFVGGVSVAGDPESAIQAAEADARSQLHLSAVERANGVFDRGIARSNIETTAMERLEFKRSLSNDYADRIVGAARRDSVYYRPCGESSAGSTTAVCEAFVQISLDDADWDTMLAQALASEKARRREEGQSKLAELAEWLSRQLGEEASQGGLERR